VKTSLSHREHRVHRDFLKVFLSGLCGSVAKNELINSLLIASVAGGASQERPQLELIFIWTRRECLWDNFPAQAGCVMYPFVCLPGESSE